MPKRLYILNGSNLNLLGTREPHLYGSTTLPEVAAQCARRAAEHGLTTVFRQTNSEGKLVDWIQEASKRAVGIVINPAGWTTSSVAVLDALLAFGGPIVEIHVTNIHRRDAFRRHSLVSQAATAVLAGFGPQGYLLAVDAIARLIAARAPSA